MVAQDDASTNVADRGRSVTTAWCSKNFLKSLQSPRPTAARQPRPIALPPAEPEPKPPEPKPSTPAKQATKADKSKKQPTGLLSLRVNDDWANVYHDGKLIDRLEVPAGHLKLELRGPNGVKRTVDVPADGWAAEVVDMK